MTKTVKDKNDYLSGYYQVECTNSEINVKLEGGISGRSLSDLLKEQKLCWMKD